MIRLNREKKNKQGVNTEVYAHSGSGNLQLEQLSLTGCMNKYTRELHRLAVTVTVTVTFLACFL
jgi:hypothetical protein